MNTRSETAKTYAAIFTRVKDDPVAFNNKVLGRTHPSLPGGYWAKQTAVLDALLATRKVVVPAGHGVGKSYLAAGAALHFAYTRPNSRVLLYGPTFSQLTEVLWAELTSAWKNSRLALPGRLVGGNSPKLVIADKWGIWGNAVGGEGVGKAGRHAGSMLVVCDEASAEGYDDVIEDLEGLNASNYLYIGNPLRHGKFKAICDQADRGFPGVTKIKISSLESPHAGLVRSPVGLADATYLAEMIATYGEDHPVYRSRVLGEFNDEDVFQLIPNDWIDRCATNPNAQDFGEVTIAVDLSAGRGQGDRTVIIARTRDSVLEVVSSKDWEYPSGVTARVKSLAELYGVTGSRVIYDQTGLGEGFGYALDQAGLRGAFGYTGAAEGGRNATTFRGACALALRDRLNPTINPRPFWIPPEFLGRLKPEIQSLRYELDIRDRLKLEAKALAKERLGRSPDFCDALVMSFSKG